MCYGVNLLFRVSCWFQWKKIKNGLWNFKKVHKMYEIRASLLYRGVRRTVPTTQAESSDASRWSLLSVKTDAVPIQSNDDDVQWTVRQNTERNRSHDVWRKTAMGTRWDWRPRYATVCVVWPQRSQDDQWNFNDEHLALIDAWVLTSDVKRWRNLNLPVLTPTESQQPEDVTVLRLDPAPFWGGGAMKRKIRNVEMLENLCVMWCMQFASKIRNTFTQFKPNLRGAFKKFVDWHT